MRPRIDLCWTKRIAILLIVILSCAAFPTKPSAALEPLRVFRGVLILEGKIEPGDYISLRNFLRDESNFDKMTGGVFLASQGGYVSEALKIGALIRALWLTTDAPASPPPEARAAGSPIIQGVDLVNPRHYQCASACFFLYVAGVNRRLIWPGRLGIHQPRIEHKPDSASDDEVTIVTFGARNAIKKYFARMDVPENYLDLMYSVPANEVRWISKEEFDRDLKGYVPELKALLDKKCKMAVGSGRGERECLAKTQIDASKTEWRRLFQQKNSRSH